MIAIDDKGDYIPGKTKKKMTVINVTDTLPCRAKR